MLLTLPIYVEVHREAGQPVHHCRPVFMSGIVAADAHLGLAMGKLNKRLKQFLDGLGSAPRHDRLAAWAFAPDLETHVLKLTLDLRDRLEKCKLLFVVLRALDRRIAFSPTLPDLWFEVSAGQRLEERAREVLVHYFREQEKLSRRSGVASTPQSVTLEGQAWITTIDLEVKTQQPAQKKIEKQLAALFDDAKLDGGLELQRVGRCLDWLYPDELNHAVARDREVTQLHRLLALRDNRPLVLVGPRLAGKTTILHECVRRRVARRRKPYSSRQNVWLLSPQRLISGMMYVGQWEGRLQAILRTARKRRHTLYFDDFLGLYRAGISRDASLSVADVLKPFILRREVRVLAEMTPEAWQALQERDRGLADQFPVLRIAATGEAETRQVMLQVHRQLEAQHRCTFELDALPTILRLHQSYVRDAAFPGKSAAFSNQLAQKHPQATITRAEVNQEFHLKTGLSLDMLDDRQRLDRDAVVQRLQNRIVGQDEAVQAAADIVTVAKARLADPGRPLATLLFLGPTGVGKTECAKALAEVIFTEPGRLLRFDMNEYGSPYSIAQLVGTFAEPDGLLTSAVRRQPFSVVLLDEIEKAHPDVFDLLLQVTGEGRLTDALGRTADFSNSVIIMTSNLGVTAGQSEIRLVAEGGSRQHAFVKAAENFFRPEFFNRIDRVIPFASLTREQMRKIADHLLAEVFQRDGLVRRRCALAVEAGAMERIVDAGYHPHFGARALKRAIERQLIQPVAASLASVKPELPAVIGVYPDPAGVTAAVHPLASVVSVDHGLTAELAPAEQTARVAAFLDRMQRKIESTRQQANDGGREISSQQLRYYALKEQGFRLREQVESLSEDLKRERHGVVIPEIAPKAAVEKMPIRSHYREPSKHHILRDIQAAQDIHDYLTESATAIPRPEEIQRRLTALRHEATLFHALDISTGTPDRALIAVRPIVPTGNSWAVDYCKLLLGVFDDLGYMCDLCPTTSADGALFGLLVSGPGIWPLAAADAGVHIYCRRHENLVPVQVSVVAGDARSAADQIRAMHSRRHAWLAEVATGHASVQDDPWPLGSIVRFYDEGGATVDLRSGRSIPRWPTLDDWKTLLLDGLPLPPELEI
jgi:ATP-dependent Clp protease ATP-binding subunit ClpC